MVAPAWALPTPTVLMCVAVQGPVSYEWACNFADIWMTRPAGATRLKLPPYGLEMAREHGALAAVQQGYRWVFFLDADVLPPGDVLHRLIAHNRPIVSGLYCRRHNPVYPLLLKRVSDSPIKFDIVKGITPGELVEVDACPTGCMLVATDVFRKMPRPWFAYTAETAIDGLSEDYFFTWKAQRFAFRTFVDTSIKCRHKGEFNVGLTDTLDPIFQVESPNP